MIESAAIFVPGLPFTSGELSAMVLDGVLTGVFGHAFTSIAQPHTPAIRAAALASSLPPSWAGRVVIGQLSAAWIYSCAAPPSHPTLFVDRDHRSTSLPGGGSYTLHEVAFGGEDVIRLAGAAVTTPLRTAVDVALREAPTVALPVLRALTKSKVQLQLLHGALEALWHIPGKRAALVLLKELD